MVAATQLIKTAPRFHRAIHARYDLRHPDTVEHFVPTYNATASIAAILRGTQAGGTQRAHVLYAAYGSGKSHLAVALAALLEKPEELRPSVHRLVESIAGTDEHTGEMARAYLERDMRLLPVVLSGNEGDLDIALLRALSRSLNDAGLGDIHLSTRFEAALNTIARWHDSYPDMIDRLALLLSEQFDLTPDELLEGFEAHDPQAFEVFQDVYSRLTGGAVFDPFVGQSPELVFRDVARQIQDFGYQGIVVLWDEFGRYLESRAAQAFSDEAASLQNFAEACNYSSEEQLHLVLITHKELQGYAAALPKTYQQEWSRIEGRFQRHDISTDPYLAYRLIDFALEQTDQKRVDALLAPEVDLLVRWSEEKRLFGMMSSEAIAQLIRGTWPLHPLTVFALPHISSRVAQNERTLFTFLTADEPNSLSRVFRPDSLDDMSELWVRPDVLWDYFEDAVRLDIGGVGAHRYWSGVANALEKVAEGDVLATTLIKTLGVLLLCAEGTSVKPDTELLCWAVGADTEEQRGAVVTTLDNLRRRKVIIHRQIDEHWTFISGSDINFEERIADVLERVNPSPAQLRRILQEHTPAPHTLARRYNQEHAMIRFFTGLYRWPHELENAPWDTQLERSQADGLVVYVLAKDDLSWRQALEALQAYERVIYVFPREADFLISLEGVLREIFGLLEISNDPTLKQHEDRARIQREIDWLLEDARTRLTRLIATLTDPREGKSLWITVEDGTAQMFPVHSVGQTTRIASDICERVFWQTPRFNNEGLNVFKPSTQQIGAAQKTIDALFANPPDETFGMEGRGPEILALNTLLKLPGILRQNEKGEWTIGRPDEDTLLAKVWDCIAGYVDQCQTEQGLPVEPLIRQLMSPPYGIRPGVIPVLLAAVLRHHLMVLTIRENGRAVTPIDGKLLTSMVFNPSHYSIEIGEWNETLENVWRALVERFNAYTHENERKQQPLTILRVSLLRWLQSLPPFCRDTRQISEEAQAFRDLVRKAQMEPARALFEDLPQLLQIDEDTSREEIAARLDMLVTEINNAYLDLQRRLDVFAIEVFGQAGQYPDGLNAMRAWLKRLQSANGKSISEYRFGSLVTQDLIDAVLSASGSDGMFWDRASVAVLGVKLRDWNDGSEERFCEKLRAAQDEVEREVHQLLEEDAVVAVSIQLPDDQARNYRFRFSEMSAHGRRLLQNFKGTLEIAGRSLPVDEKRKIALAFLAFVMGEELDD